MNCKSSSYIMNEKYHACAYMRPPDLEITPTKEKENKI